MVESYLDRFLKHLKGEKNYSPHTLKAYTHDLREFFSFISGARIEEVDLMILRKYLAHLKENDLSKRTMARRSAALRTFFKFLTREGDLKKNPLAALRNPKLDKKLPMVLDENQVTRLLEAPEGDLSGQIGRASCRERVCQYV